MRQYVSIKQFCQHTTLMPSSAKYFMFGGVRCGEAALRISFAAAVRGFNTPQ
jgi:hypothetical protein